MSKLPTSGIAAMLVLFGSAYAQQPQQQPSTPQTEGTAADRTAPGATPTQGTQGVTSPDENPIPSTSETEGTVADRSAPGQTPTGAAARRTELVGTAVVSDAQAPLGKVVDVVFDSKSRPEFVVIASEGKSVAVPYSVASSMKAADKIVMERDKLQSAPKVKQGEWLKESGNWKGEAIRYWNEG
jgi:PRC-barrel domain